jgi:uncharacterized phage protein gp47/JayE
MADVPTQVDLFDAARREALLNPTRFDTAIIDTPGSDVNVVFNVGASMGEEVARFFQAGFNKNFLSTATGEALDRWVYDRYQLTRKDATAAVALLRLTRADTSVGVTIPQGSTFATNNGVVFETTVDSVLGAGNAGPVDVNAVARRTGTEGNVAAETIVTVTSSLAVQDIEVTNVDPAAGGNEEETDDELRSRAREFFVNARRGTKSAIEFGALQVARIAQATAIENLNTTTSEPAFRVQLTISDANGQANLALAAEVEESLLEFRALGVPVSVIPAVPQYVTITAAGLLFEAGANTSRVISNARAAILGVVNGLPPGETLRRASILGALQNVNQLIVPDSALTEPVGDLVPSLGSVIRTTSDRINLST